MACKAQERRSTVADLKPCPFCGSAPELRTSHGWYAVGCGTTMKCPAYIYALTHRSQAEAVATWNKRTPGVPVAHPTDGERDLAALCVRLVRRLREVSPDDKLGATATDYLNQRRYLNPLRIKAMGPAPADGVPVAPKTSGGEPS